MPKIKDILGKAIRFKQPKLQKVVKIPAPPKDAICADMLTIYEWLMKYKGQAPFFCLMLQEQFELSFLLNPDGEPTIFKEWNVVEQERKNMDDPRIWILEFEGEPN